MAEQGLKFKGFPFNILLDACAFHAPEASEKKSFEELLKLRDQGIISVLVPYPVDHELSQAPPQIAVSRIREIYTIEVSLTPEERERIRSIRNLLFGNRQQLAPNEKNDVISLFEAAKYGRYFVTYDKKHILCKTSEIQKLLGIKVLTPSQMLKEINDWLNRHNLHQG